MYPAALHMVRYRQSYLGPNTNTVFAFIKGHHASLVKDALKYESPQVACPSPRTYTLRIRPNTRLRRPMKRQNLTVHTADTATTLFFASVNNVNMALIDEVAQKNDMIEMRSNYEIAIDFDGAVLENAKCNHLDRLYEKDELEKIDYSEELSNMLINAATIPFDIDDIDLDDNDDWEGL